MTNTQSQQPLGDASAFVLAAHARYARIDKQLQIAWLMAWSPVVTLGVMLSFPLNGISGIFQSVGQPPWWAYGLTAASAIAFGLSVPLAIIGGIIHYTNQFRLKRLYKEAPPDAMPMWPPLTTGEQLGRARVVYADSHQLIIRTSFVPSWLRTFVTTAWLSWVLIIGTLSYSVVTGITPSSGTLLPMALIAFLVVLLCGLSLIDVKWHNHRALRRRTGRSHAPSPSTHPGVPAHHAGHPWRRYSSRPT